MKPPEVPFVYLQPGEAHFSEAPARVATLLGSCVAVTMFCTRLKVGGICHVLLPRCRRELCVAGCEDIYRYADCSIRAMLAWFADRGAGADDLVVKVFGGSDILLTDPDRKHLSVGRRNVECARRSLLREGLVPSSCHVGGTTGRKIVFLTHTGEVLMRRIGSTVFLKGDLCRPRAGKQRC